MIDAVAAMASAGRIGVRRNKLLDRFLYRACTPGGRAAGREACGGLNDLVAHLLDVGAAASEEMLFDAIRDGDAQLVEALLKSNAQSNSQRPWTLSGANSLRSPGGYYGVLVMAIRDCSAKGGGRLAVAEILLRYGADVNEKDDRLGSTPLYYAVQHAKYLPDEGMVAFLLSKNADIFAEGAGGGLLCAAIKGRVPDRIVGAFLDRAEQFEKQSPRGWRWEVELGLSCAMDRESELAHDASDRDHDREDLQKAIQQIKAYSSKGVGVREQ